VFVEQLHRGGIPSDLVQLVVCEDGPVGRHLVTHPGVDTVILTGSLATARLFLEWDPSLRLFAETSGKNALVITAAADLDLAIADLVRSAFGHAGQKCSAASLAIVEAPLYDSPAFLERLRHAVESWKVAWPDDRAAMIGPVIKPPEDALARGLTQLDHGETWLVEPAPLDDSGRLWRPGVRLGVQRGSWFHRTECFGPVLGLMRAADLDEAIAIENDSELGLTGGIHSLDTGEIERWVDAVEVGNVYVNRAITGAVVQRQPFGGWKQSSVGPGAKAGGPSYVLQFARIDEATTVPLATAEASYEQWWASWFSIDHDPTGLACESNVLRHRPVVRVIAWHRGEAVALDRLRAAAGVTGVPLTELDAREATEDALLASIGAGDRLRIVTDASPSLLRACTQQGVWFHRGTPSWHGRVELLLWVREQAISRTLHRHGRLA
jgi:RHH-type proline utilization regulon transcriptional repressor/proline dehydrogenase/delta 1-pyrroline-5-carboxylate dehydrogenase